MAALLTTGPQNARGEAAWKAAETSDDSEHAAPSEAPVSEPSMESSTDSVDEAASEADSVMPIVHSSDGTTDMAVTADEDGQTSRTGTSRTTGVPSSDFASLKTLGRKPAVQKPDVMEPVAFQGMVVGTSTGRQLLEEWGDPADTVATAEGNVLAFDIAPFQAVEVLVDGNDVVTAIKIALASPLNPKQLADQLALGDIRTVTAYDEVDEPLGLAFPERGVIFMYDA
jgi:hypothetical protein